MNAIFQDVISESASTVLSDTFPNPRKRVATRPPRATMRAATAVMALGLLASAVTTLTPAFAQTTLTVTSTLDYGGPATSGTLRQVLEYQSINCYGPFSPFTINFNIAGGGPHTFQPSSAYPAISCDSTVINGYSQPGATANSTGLVVYSTTPSGNDANIQIILNGISAGSSRGLTITGNTVTVKGLAIRSFQQEGIFVTGNSALIQGNYIGTDPGGMNGYGNGFAGIKVAGGSGTQIGGGGAAGTNLITGNTFASVQVFAPATNFKVWSNMLGGDRSGGGAISGGGNGAVEIIASPCASPVAMGGDVYGNRIRYNAGSGVYIDDCASNNNVSESVIALNVSKAINTNTSGNSGLVKPSITSVAYSASGTSIAGTYTAVISGNHRIDLYGNPTPPTVSEAQYYVPSSSYSANAPSTGPGQPFTVSNSAIVPNPAVTLTRNTIGTSELSDLYRTPFSFSPGSGVNAILPAFTAFSGTAGGATQYQTISVTNTSGSTISWGATPLTLTGDTARFTVASGPTPCASSTSGPSGACDIKIGFASATSGTYNAVATFSVIHNGIESKVEVALTGTASGGGPIFTVSGAPTFPNTAVNGRSDFQTVTVTNTGSANLNISSIGLNNPAEFGDSYFGDIRPLANTGYAWCGLGSDATGAPAAGSRTLPPGQYCTLYLYFKPTSTGLRSGTLTFVTDASPSVQTIELSGGGVIGNAPTVPGTPTATAYNGYALVSFSGSSSPDGRVGYTVVSNPPGGFDSNAGSSNTAHIITGLSNGTAYTFTVQASNGAGTSISPASNSVTPTTPSASLPKPVSQSNLLAYYPFSGSSADAMGGSPYSIGAATLTGGSLSLGGTADYANTSANLDGVGYKSFSVSVDFNMNASFAGGPVVVLGPSYRSLEFGVDSSLNPRLAWSNVGSGYTAPSTGQTAFTGTTLAKGVWYRGTVVVDVYSATPSISLYIDGALVGSVVSPTLPNNFMFDAFYSDANAYDRVFSFVNGANGGAFKGLANNLLVYGTALTGGEVASLNSALGAMGSSLNPTASPTSLVFDDTAVGTDSVAKKVTVANPNASPLPILGVYVTAAGGSQPDFTFDVSACTGSQIPALGTCDIYVKFTPQSATEFPSELNINTAASPLVVPLSGISWPYSMEDSGGVTFAPTPVGGSAGPLTMTFTNLSLGAAIVNAVSLSGTNPADFSITANTCVNPGVLAASDGTCSVDITFTPLSSGAKSATVTLQQGGVSFISSVISGDAVAGLTPAPSSINFGSVTSGASSAVTTVTITKDSSVGCIDWNAPTITGAGAANFAVASNTCTGSFTGTTCTIGLRFDATGPAAVKTATASISGAFDTGCYSLTAVAPIEPELKSARRITAKSGPLYTASIALSGTVLSSGAAPALTSGTPAGGLVGQAYSFGFTASGTGPITWSIVSGSLPPGLTLNSSTGAITGTPTVAGTSTFTIRATNSAGQANLATSITITAPVISILSLSTSSLNFGNQNLGVTSAAQDITITNTGNGAFSILSVSGIGDFGYVSNCPLAPATIQPNASCTISVTFSPLIAGAATGRISINNNAAQQGPNGNSISLTGTGVAIPRASIIVNPASLSFGEQAVGSSSAPQVVFISNTGQAVMELQGLSLSPTTGGSFTIGSPPAADNPRNHPLCAAGNTIAAGASCAIGVTFSPITTGSLTGSLTVTHNATATGATGTTNIGFTGTGTPRREPLIRVSGTLTFGEQILGTTSAAQPVTVTNIGTANLNVSSLAITPNANTNVGDFQVSGSCASLAPNANCNLGVTFSPSASGSIGDKGATLVVASNATNSSPATAQVALTGKAIPVPQPSIRLSATILGFGNVIYGSTPARQTVTLTNTGTLALTILGISSTGHSDFSQTNTCGTTVNPDQSCVINLLFSPHALGTRTGGVSIRSNAPNSPTTIQLGGTGCRYFSPAAARFFLTSC